MKRCETESGDDSDADLDFLDRVLNKLYDFGDEAKGKKPKKKKKRGNEEELAAVEEEDSNDKRSGRNEEADLMHRRIPVSSDATCASSSSSSNVEIVTFQDPLKKKKLKRAVEQEPAPPEVTDKKEEEPDDVLNIEKARLEVHRFGITGFHKQQQRVFEQDRAIMLGARPPKRDYVNYKVYQQTIKEKRLKEKEEMKSDTHGKKRKPGASGKPKTVKRKSGSSKAEPTGQVGRFKNGMLVLSHKDLQKLKVKVRK